MKEKRAKDEKRRTWTAEEKGKIVRRYLQDKVSLADLADETGASISSISEWSKMLLESADEFFAGSQKSKEKKASKELAIKEERIVHLQEVVSELSCEVLRLKKASGAGLAATMSRLR